MDGVRWCPLPPSALPLGGVKATEACAVGGDGVSRPARPRRRRQRHAARTRHSASAAEAAEDERHDRHVSDHQEEARVAVGRGEAIEGQPGESFELAASQKTEREEARFDAATGAGRRKGRQLR